MIRIVASILMILGLVCIQSPVFGEGINLRYRFTPGTVFQTTFVKTKRMQVEGERGDWEQNSASLSRRLFKVLSVDEHGMAEIEMKIDFIETTYNTPDGSLKKVDTREVDNDTPIRQLLLHPVVFTVNPKGQIIAVDRAEERLDDFYSRFEPESDEEKFLLDFLVTAFYSEENIRQILPRFVFPEYPDRPIKVGESWSKTDALDFEKIKGEVAMNYTLKDVDEKGRQWRISFDEGFTRYETNDPKLAVEVSESSSEGHYLVDSDTGLPQSMELDTDYQLDVFQKHPNGSREWGATQTSIMHYAMDTGDRYSTLPPLNSLEEPENLQAQDSGVLIEEAAKKYKQLNYQKAKALLLKAQDKITPSIPLEYQANFYALLGMVCTDLEQYDRAEIAFDKLEKILTAPSIPHPQEARLFLRYRQARLYHQKKDYERAESYYKEVLALQRKTGHSEIYQTLHDYAVMKKEQQQYGRAESLIREALALTRSRMGDSHPDVAMTMNELAQILSYEKKYREAESLLLDSMAILKASLEEDHPNRAIAMRDLATVYLAQAQPEKASPYVKEGIRILEKARDYMGLYYGKEHPDFLKLSKTLSDLKRLEQQTALKK